MADRLGTIIENGNAVQMLFDGMSATQIAAILLFGAHKEELQKMVDNASLAQEQRN